jgi:hypothetical protein
MKIQGTPALPVAERMSRATSRVAVEDAGRAVPDGDVRLTGGARFVSEVRAAVDTLSEVRALEIVRAREDVASGQLLTDTEIEAAVDGLLAGL